MAYENFISKTILKNEVQGKKISKPITRIAIISIALSIVVNLITIMVVKGFQSEVKEKINGFSSHLFVMDGSATNIQEANPILFHQDLYKQIQKNPEVLKIQRVAYKPILLQHKVTIEDEEQNQILGGVLKGIDSDYDTHFFKEQLTEGAMPVQWETGQLPEILISKRIQKDLGIHTRDTIKAYFVQNKPVLKLFVIAGIYETGLEEFDKKTILGDIQIIQELNQWGIKARIRIADTLKNDQLIVYANATENQHQLLYDWGQGFEKYSGFSFFLEKDTTIRLIIQDQKNKAFRDTAYLSISNVHKGSNTFAFNEEHQLVREYPTQNENEYQIKTKKGFIKFVQKDGEGNSKDYIGGYEINIKDWNLLKQSHKKITNLIELSPEFADLNLHVTNIIDQQTDIFMWLGFLDVNVLIILVLMILIGIINMSSSLLVMIIVRSNFIGILKALGATNWSIRKIFLYHAFYLIWRGILWGNGFALTIYILQKKFHLLTLDPEVYYLKEVPFHFDLFSWVLLNIGTIVICLLALLIPSYMITRIKPSKAIKFQ